jgi:hypothetical protein
VGSNDYGECNVSGWTDITQVAAGNIHTVGVKDNGTVVAVGNNYYGQCNVSGWTDIVQVSASGCYYHTVGLKADGTVVAEGNNYYGQCNVGTWTGIIQVAAGNWHTVGLRSDGTVAAVGDNSYGQCGRVPEVVVVTETVTDGTVDARDEADTEVEVDGTATVTVFPYDENPGGDAPTGFDALDKYIDVYVPDTREANELEIRLFYTDNALAAAGIDDESLLQLLWWDGDDWNECSDSGVSTTSTNGYSGYMWAKIRNDTTPPLGQLQGTAWGGYGHPRQTTQPCCTAAAAAASGPNAPEKLNTLRQFRDEVMLPNSLGATLVSLYYRTSPPVANFISQHQVLTRLVRVGFVDAIVAILNWTHHLW